jgi:hypothetical protein
MGEGRNEMSLPKDRGQSSLFDTGFMLPDVLGPEEVFSHFQGKMRMNYCGG